MLCARCGLEMRIQASMTRPEQDNDGVLRIYHVNEVACVNKQCGGQGRAQEVKTLLWEGGAEEVGKTEG